MLITTYDKDNPFSSNDMYQIMANAIISASVDGYINSFIYERALFVYAAGFLYPEKLDEISEAVDGGNILDTWDYLLKEGIIEDMADNYKRYLDDLADCAQIWYTENNQYDASFKGLIDVLSTLTSQLVNTNANALSDVINQENVQTVLQISDKWGMNNGIDNTKQELKEYPEDSMFGE